MLTVNAQSVTQGDENERSLPCMSLENWVGTPQPTSISTACALMLNVPKNVFNLMICGSYKRVAVHMQAHINDSCQVLDLNNETKL